jgi:hypothetical protein
MAGRTWPIVDRAPEPIAIGFGAKNKGVNNNGRRVDFSCEAERLVLVSRGFIRRLDNLLASVR